MLRCLLSPLATLLYPAKFSPLRPRLSPCSSSLDFVFVTTTFVVTMVRHHASSHPLTHPVAAADDDVEASKAYEEAVRTLNSLQSNKETIEKIRKERDKNKYKQVPNTRRYLARVGVSEAQLGQLSVIHVSGTKGKGSTCAFTESILRHHGHKTGFFSSPHLIQVRERIRINGEPLSRKKFTEYFWNVYNQLQRATLDVNIPAVDELNMPTYFNFLTIMAIHAFIKEEVDVAVIEVGIGGEFDCTNVIPAPVVCGVSSLGLDHTAILGTTIKSIAWHKSGIFKPSAVAFTVPQPREALEVLAQRAEERNTSLSVVSSILTSYCSYGQEPSPWSDAVTADGDFVDSGSGNPLKLGIHGQAQFWNASLALHLAQAWMEKRPRREADEDGGRRNGGDDNGNSSPYSVGEGGGDGAAAPYPDDSSSTPWRSFGSDSSSMNTDSSVSVTLSPPHFSDEGISTAMTSLPAAAPFPLRPPHLAGLRRTVWPGRSQIVKIHADLSFYLDGAHTSDSISNCASWFKEETLKEEIYQDGYSRGQREKNFVRVLLFNVTGERNPRPLLELLNDINFDMAVFCTNATASASVAGNSADQTKKASDDSFNRKTCLENLRVWRQMQSERPSGEATAASSSSTAFFLESIRDSLNFLNVNNGEPVYCDGTLVPRPDWLRAGVHVQVLATGSLYLVGGVLKLIDPDLNGSLLDN